MTEEERQGKKGREWRERTTEMGKREKERWKKS